MKENNLEERKNEYLKDLKNDFPKAYKACEKFVVETNDYGICGLHIVYNEKGLSFRSHFDTIEFMKKIEQEIKDFEASRLSFFFDQDGVVWHYDKEKDMTTCKLGARHQVENGYIYFMESDDAVIDKFKLYSYKLFDKII